MPLKNPPRAAGRPPEYNAQSVVLIDRSDETIIIVCQLCTWRTCSDDEIPARRDLVLHLVQEHQGEQDVARPRRERQSITNTKDAHLKWLRRHGVHVVIIDIKFL